MIAPAGQKVPHRVSFPDAALLDRYDTAAPRYTSYPTALQFRPDFTAEHYLEAVGDHLKGTTNPWSLYFHLPFCRSVCLFCGCHAIHTRDTRRAGPYVDLLIREMDNLLERLPTTRPVVQIHWGGGTPTFLAPEEMKRLMDAIRSRFMIAPGAEVGVEVDPRETTLRHLEVMRACGVNRLSMGVQDVDPRVQKAINRIQPEEQVEGLVQASRELGFASISLDLIYGLPLQTVEGFEETVRRVVAWDPDRVSLFNFAYLPTRIRHQRGISSSELPPREVKLQLLRTAMEAFGGLGYRHVGMDHFAKPGDPLCVAQDKGRLHRNFQGYSTCGGADLFGFGASSIGGVGPVYAQNEKELAAYGERVMAGDVPVVRGIGLNADDLLRRRVIMDLMCRLKLSWKDYSRESSGAGISWSSWSRELPVLKKLEADGLVKIGPSGLGVTELGRFFIRNIAAVFDVYMGDGTRRAFSKTI